MGGYGQCVPQQDADLMSGALSCEDMTLQNTEQPTSMAPVDDPTCRALSTGSMEFIRQFLVTANSELETWEGWRDGDGWDGGAGDDMPSLQRLSAAARTFSRQNFTCSEQDEEGVTANDQLVRDALTNGVGGEEGLDAQDIRLMNEWMGYDGGLISGLSSYFCLTPTRVVHSYGIRLEVGLSGGAGLGAGGKVETPLGEIALGCYPMVEGTISLLEFSYSNNLGLRWTSEYAQGTISIGAECAARLSIGPSVATSFGNQDLCSGSASSDTWYGPGDFAGGAVNLEGGVDGGMGVVAGVAASVMTVIPAASKPAITFNTTGACLELGASMGAGVGVSAGGGGQLDVADPTMSNQSVADVEGLDPADPGLGACAPQPMHDVVRDGWRTLITRHLFFDTGSSDAQSGDEASNNVSAIQDITEALAAAGATFTPSEVRFSVTGHASPVWVGARDEHAAAEENLALAGARADSSLELVQTAYGQFGGDWPDASVEIDRICVENETPAGQTATHNMGSSEGLAETGDPNNNDARYRRATIVVNVAHFREERRTVPLN